MMSKPAVLGSLLLAGVVAISCSKTSTRSLVPPQTVYMDFHTLQGIPGRVGGVPRAAAESARTDAPGGPKVYRGAGGRASAGLHGCGHAARKGARHGMIFKPEVETAFRSILQKEQPGAPEPYARSHGSGDGLRQRRLQRSGRLLVGAPVAPPEAAAAAAGVVLRLRRSSSTSFACVARRTRAYVRLTYARSASGMPGSERGKAVRAHGYCVPAAA
jgi:hypothetical protein